MAHCRYGKDNREASQQGGVTTSLFHCVFNDDGSITHYLDEADPGLSQALPNTYAVCLADNSGATRKVVAGFVAKTTFTHNDSGFQDAMYGIV